jgi:hypothetical protein
MFGMVIWAVAVASWGKRMTCDGSHNGRGPYSIWYEYKRECTGIPAVQAHPASQQEIGWRGRGIEAVQAKQRVGK